MALLSANKIERIEVEFREGISSTAIVDLFKRSGERFSEATLRKYVQLELLPKSRRVGARGRHKGSIGLYPVGIVRLINEIKRALESGATLEEVRNSQVGLSGEVQKLGRVSLQVLGRLDEAIQTKEGDVRGVLGRSLSRHRRSIERQLEELQEFASRVGGADTSDEGVCASREL